MEFSGVTGDIYLDQNGHRTYFKMDLIEKSRDNMVKTGIWSPDTGVNYTTTAVERDAIVVEQLQNKTLRVTTAKVRLMFLKDFKTRIKKLILILRKKLIDLIRGLQCLAKKLFDIFPYKV